MSAWRKLHVGGESWFQLCVLRSTLNLPRSGERETTAGERKKARTHLSRHFEAETCSGTATPEAPSRRASNYS